jgi:HK97 family phage major capsid protein
MSTATIDPVDVQKRLAEAPPEKRGEILAELARANGAIPQKPEQFVTFSPEEEKRLIDGLLGEADKLIEQKAKDIERKFETPRSEAVAIVEDAAGRAAKERILKRQKYDIIARRIGTTLLRGQGQDRQGLYDKTAEEEAEFLRKNFGSERAERAMSLANDAAGGALAPEVFESEVYHNLQSTALNRRLCDVKEIPLGQEIKKWPKISSDLTAEVKAEASGATPSDIATGTFSLEPKTIVAMSGPISIELLMASSMNIVDHLISRASKVFQTKEDYYLFNGDGGTNWNGLLADVPSAQEVKMANGETIANIDFDNLIDMEYELADHYIPDEDVEGSANVAGEAFYFFNSAAYKNLKKLRADGATGQYLYALEEMFRERRLNGHRFRRVPHLPTPATVDTRFGLFGNLKYTWVGVRPGILIETSNDAQVGGTNLWTTGQRALRFLEFWDYAQVDDGSLSVIETGATAG